MKTAKLKEAKTLVERDRKMATNPKKVTYSKETKEKVYGLLTEMSVQKISNELGVSRCFIDRTRTKRRKTENSIVNNDNALPVQFMELPNDFMKEELQPTLKVTTPRGLIIEIFG